MPMRFVSVMKDAPYSPAENMTIDALGFQVASKKKMPKSLKNDSIIPAMNCSIVGAWCGKNRENNNT